MRGEGGESRVFGVTNLRVELVEGVFLVAGHELDSRGSHLGERRQRTRAAETLLLGPPENNPHRSIFIIIALRVR